MPLRKIKRRHKVGSRKQLKKVKRMYILRRAEDTQTPRGIDQDDRRTCKKRVATISLFSKKPPKTRKRYDVTGLDTAGGLCGRFRRGKRKTKPIFKDTLLYRRRV